LGGAAQNTQAVVLSGVHAVFVNLTAGLNFWRMVFHALDFEVSE
jgi:hypothetical protein